LKINATIHPQFTNKFYLSKLGQGNSLLKRVHSQLGDSSAWRKSSHLSHLAAKIVDYAGWLAFAAKNVFWRFIVSSKARDAAG
jgi:hypothetical protein